MRACRMRSSKPAGNGRAAWQWQVSPRETATRNGIDSGEQYLARVKEYTFETSAAGQIAARKAYPRNLLRVRISRASRTETRRTNAQVIAFRFASPTHSRSNPLENPRDLHRGPCALSARGRDASCIEPFSDGPQCVGARAAPDRRQGTFRLNRGSAVQIRNWRRAPALSATTSTTN